MCTWPARVREVSRLHAAAQAIHGVVGERDRLLLVAVRLDRQHRAEDLLASDPHIGAHFGKHRRPGEEATRQVRRPSGSARDELRALGDAGVDHRLDALELGAVSYTHLTLPTSDLV